MFRSIQYYWCSLCYKSYVRLYISIEFQAFLMCSGIHGNRQVVVQSGAFYQLNEQRAIAARSHVRYNIFTRTRDIKRGGGLAVYVKEQTPVMVLNEIKVPEELECLWLWVRPHRLPRSVSGMVVYAVYIPPKSPHQTLLVNHIISTLDELKIKHPDMGITILGDFNRTEIRPICRAHALSQVVNKPTRVNAILDLIITNVKLFYDDPSVSSPVGSSDHVTIYILVPGGGGTQWKGGYGDVRPR